MATAETDPEEVSCPVCLEPYTGPKSLKCGHVLCTNCINEMLDRSSVACIKCSICREISFKHDLRRDFTMEQIVEKYPEAKARRDTVLDSTHSLDVSQTLCEICLKTQCQFQCHECKQLICTDCLKLHSRIEATRNHRISTMDEIKVKATDNMRKLISRYSTAVVKVAEKLEIVDKLKDDVKNKEAETKSILSDMSNKIMKACTDMTEMVQSESETAVQDLGQTEQRLIDMRGVFDVRKTFLYDIIAEGNTSTLLDPELLQELQEQSDIDEALLTEDLTNMPILPNFDSVIECSNKIENALSNKGVLCTETEYVSYQHSLITLTNKTLHKCRESTLKHNCFRLNVINGELWAYGVIGSNVILVYDDHGRMTTEIKIKQENIFVSCCAETSQGHIIITTGNALYSISSENGAIVSTLAHGNYVHVVCQDGMVYGRTASKGNGCFVITKHKLDKEDYWQCEEQLEVKHKNELSTSFAVTDDAIYFMYANTAILLNHNGERKKKIKLKDVPKSNTESWISASDYKGFVLVLVQNDDKREVIVIKEEHICYTIQLNMHPCGLWDAAIDSKGKLWLLVRSNHQSQLLQFCE